MGTYPRIDDAVIAWHALADRMLARALNSLACRRVFPAFQMRARIDDATVRQRSRQAIVNDQFRLETLEFKAY